jgi:hypothetical protein
MATKKLKFFFQIILGIFMLSFAVAACNNNSEKKETTDSTTMPMDTTKMMDTSKMDTGSTKPVKPGE